MRTMVIPNIGLHIITPQAAAVAFPVTGIKAYWKLDETDGDRIDSSGNGYTMSKAGSPTYRAGKIGNAVDIPNDSNCLSCTNVGLRLLVGTSMTVSAWVYMDNWDALSAYPIGRWATVGDWCMAVDPAGKGQFVLDTDGAIGVAATPNGVVTTGAWHLIIGWFDHTVGGSGTVYVQVDNGTVYSTALSAVHVSDATVYTAIGRLGSNAYGSFDGAVDELGIWSRVLTSEERIILWNGGTGITYS